MFCFFFLLLSLLVSQPLRICGITLRFTAVVKHIIVGTTITLIQERGVWIFPWKGCDELNEGGSKKGGIAN